MKATDKLNKTYCLDANTRERKIEKLAIITIQFEMIDRICLTYELDLYSICFN